MAEHAEQEDDEAQHNQANFLDVDALMMFFALTIILTAAFLGA
ncbi:hypothetical protein [Methylobacterium oxalidis]